MRTSIRTSLATFLASTLLLASLPWSVWAAVPRESGIEASAAGPRTVLVAMTRGSDPESVRRAIARAGGRVERSYRYRAMLVKPPSGESARDFARVAGAIPGVRYAIGNARIHAVGAPMLAAGTANDPRFLEQWGLPAIGATTAWDSAEGEGVSVAVLDSGIDVAHRDLGGAVVMYWNYLDPGAEPLDDFGHGTHVAGIIAAVRNNHVDIAGAAPRAKVYAFKVLDAGGEGDMATAIEAIRDAVDYTPCKIISMSFGGDLNDDAEGLALQEAVDYATAKGRVVVAATGNSGNTVPFYPASTPGVIGVGSVGTTGTRSVFSNYGLGLVDLVAPGESILSTVLNDGLQAWYGTSMATPFVSASAALLWSRYPALTGAQVTSLLERTAVDLGAPGVDGEYGYGLVRPDAAIAKVASASVRLAGATRYDTAVRIAAEAYPGWNGVTDVVLTSGEDRAAADPLSAAGLCNLYHAPLLLTKGGALGADARAAIVAMPKPLAVHIVGGPGSVTSAVESALGAIPGVRVDRVGGADRYALAANVIERIRTVRAQQGGTAPRVVLVANGAQPKTFFDALALSAVSASRGYPILLVKSDAVPAASAEALRRLAPDEVWVGGGTGTVNDSVAAAVGATGRWAGATRYDTARAIADGAIARGWLSASAASVAAKLPDALTGGAALGARGVPVLVTTGSSLSTQTAGFLAARHATISAVDVLGGTGSVSPATLDAAAVALQ